MAVKTTNLVDLGTAEGFNPWPQAAGPPVQYAQKVWDSGGGGRWCYFALATITSTPLADETTPNWSGAISNHVLLSEI